MLTVVGTATAYKKLPLKEWSKIKSVKTDDTNSRAGN